MSEHSVVAETPTPRTRESLAADLRKLGLHPGMVVIVHSALSKIGWVSGGPVAVVQALMDVITEAGTIVMPTQTPHYSDPSEWENPPVPKDWHEKIRQSMPAYEPEITPSIGMGAIAETFRTYPGVHRSGHPAYSMAAWGAHAKMITENHQLHDGLGEQSPLARVYELDGSVLLLGVGHGNNTSLHLAEYRSGVRKKVQAGAPLIENGRRVWKTYTDIDLDEECFEALGSDFERAVDVRRGKVGSATSTLIRQREAVDFAVDWLIRKNETKSR